MTISKIIYDQAVLDLGVYEWRGSDHNPVVVAYYEKAGHPEITNDEVPWCAAYVGAKLAEVGLIGTGSLLARSYTQWGVDVPVGKAQKGDIVILSRGEPWQGHVGFFDRYANGRVYLLGGNQNNQVNISDYDAGRIVAVRRGIAPRASRSGSKQLKISAAQIMTGVGEVGYAVKELDGTTQIVVVVSGVALICLGVWFFRERLHKWARGVK